jgi:[acyl-carrier-protein] S-malonyltransferase
MAGHSLGEYTALLCADALEITDAVSLVRDRAQAMQDAVPEGTGAIAALIGVEMHDVVELCKEASRVGIVEPANLNAPGQIVIAGHKPAVEKAIELAKSRGAKRAVMLPMSVPSHCALMRAAADRLSERLNQIDFKAPAVPVISNADVAINSSSHDIKVALAKQLFSPVRWIETIQLLSHKGVTTFVECGPGQVLIGMVKRISPGARILALKDMAAIEQTVKELSA